MLEIATLIIGTVTTALIALVVFAKNNNNITNRLFVGLAAGLIGWSITTYFSLHTTTDQQTLMWIRWIMAFVVIQNTFFFYLVWVFPDHRTIILRKKRFLVAGVYSLITALVAVSPFLFVDFKEGAPVPGPGMALFMPHALIFAGGGIVVLVTRYLRAHGIEKSQLGYFLAGTLLMVTLEPIGNFVVPVVFKNNFMVAFSSLYSIVFSGLIAFAILKKRLFNVRLIVARSVAYALSIGALALAYALISSLILNNMFSDDTSDIIVTGTSAVMVAIAVALYQPLKGFFDKFTNKLFYRDAYDPQAFIDKLNRAVINNIDLEALLRRASHVIQINLKTEHCAFAVYSDNHTLIKLVQPATGALDNEEAEIICNNLHKGNRKVILADDLSQTNSEVYKIMVRHEIAAIARSVSTSDASSLSAVYLILGSKKSGNAYNKQDVQIVKIVTDELVIAIQNALRFEEIQRFNMTLQEKVDNATTRLRKTNEKLKEIDETKDDFISMASHQLRTPLTSVKGYLSMVLEGDAGKVTPMQRKMLEQAFVSSQRMTYLISDLLNVSRLKTGKFVIERTPTNLVTMVEQELSQLTEAAKGRNLTLIFHPPKDFPTVMLDETKTRQLVMNFVDNAIYYTPAGGTIEIKVENKSESVELTVVDTGLGVPRKDQAHLFTKFYRAQNARKARPDGTGLGLFMAKKVIVAQGGAIIFSSQEGKGSTFGFTFPKTKELLALR